ncbi:hypothetical protein Bbelb_270680 [Branchiostoma belcheri]|nr:hypothetical protein Bbelb_270680 [Branchiostoma belcheri]
MPGPGTGRSYYLLKPNQGPGLPGADREHSPVPQRPERLTERPYTVRVCRLLPVAVSTHTHPYGGTPPSLPEGRSRRKDGHQMTHFVAASQQETQEEGTAELPMPLSHIGRARLCGAWDAIDRVDRESSYSYSYLE